MSSQKIKNETPRTDSETWRPLDENGETEVVDAGFARQLERELVALKHELVALKRELDYLKNY